MSKKGHTAPQTASVRRAKQHKKAVAQLDTLLDCVQFYKRNRADYTQAEMDRLEEAVQIQRVNIRELAK